MTPDAVGLPRGLGVVEAVLAEYDFDNWTAYETRDIGPAFDAEVVRGLVADIRGALVAGMFDPESTP